jgi:hypothetical protein
MEIIFDSMNKNIKYKSVDKLDELDELDEYKKKCNIVKIYTLKKEEVKEVEYTTTRYKFDYLVLNDCIISNFDCVFYKNKSFIIFEGGIMTCRHMKDRFDSICKNITNKIQTINDRVILLSSVWGNAIFHYPFDCMSRLLCLPEEILNDTSIKIHVNEVNKYTRQWNNFFGIDEKRLITGSILKCKQVIIPRPQCAGSSNIDCNLFVRKTLLDKLMKDKIIDMNQINQFKYLTFIKRNQSRILNKNFENNLINYLKIIAQKNNISIHIHDDNNLPSLEKQFEIFYNSKYVIGPHGGGGICLYAMQKNTFYVELMPKNRENYCYTELARDFDINYFAFIYDEHQLDSFDFNLFEKTLS